MKTDREVKELFFEIETYENILNYTIQGYPLYFMMRFQLEMDYRNSALKGVFKKSLILKIKIILKKSLNSIIELFNKPVQANYKSDNINIIQPCKILFISTSDWTRNPGESMELYDIINYYKSKGQIINFVQPVYSTIIHKQSYYDGFYPINFSKSELTKDDKFTIEKCLKEISTHLNINLLTLINNYYHNIATTLSLTKQMKELIQECKCKYVMARSVYTEPWVILACHTTDTRCIEVQHGVVAFDNIYYQSPLLPKHRNGKLLMPDYILNLGEEWQQILLSQKSGYAKRNTFVLGVKMEKMKEKKSADNSLNVLICPQTGIYSIDNILELFFSKYGHRMASEKITIILRPHPNSYSDKNLKYTTWSNSSITIQNPKQIKLFEAFNYSDLLVSPCSMSLYEAIAHGIPTASFEKFRYLTIEKGLKYLKDEEDLWNFIISIKNAQYHQIQVPYLSPFNTRVLDKFIS